MFEPSWLEAVRLCENYISVGSKGDKEVASLTDLHASKLIETSWSKSKLTAEKLVAEAYLS